MSDNDIDNGSDEFNEADEDLTLDDDVHPSSAPLEPPMPPRGGSVFLKIVLLFVVVAAGGAYIVLRGPHGMLRHMPSHPSAPQTARHYPAPLPSPLPASMPAAAPVQKAAVAIGAPSLPVVNDKPPSAALLAPAPDERGIPSPSPISNAPPSPFAIPSGHHAAPPAMAENGHQPSPPQPSAFSPAQHVGIVVTGARTMPAVIVQNVDKTNIVPPKTGIAVQNGVKGWSSDDLHAMQKNQQAAPSFASPVAVASSAAEIKALKEKIAQLEKTISALQQAPVVEQPKISHHHVVHHTHKVEHRHVVHHHVVHHKAAPAPHWVLRAAKPGVAWLARQGENTLDMVKPGDFLEGIGEIKFIIHDSSGAWVVVGTKGRISQ